MLYRMALQPCAECGNNISTLASACPHCGSPGAAFRHERAAVGTPLTTIQKTSKKLKIETLIALGMIPLGMLIWWLESGRGHEYQYGLPTIVAGITYAVIMRLRIWWHHG